MMRPDEKKFTIMSEALTAFDIRFQGFAETHEFEFKKNIGRHPNRELHKAGNPFWIMGIDLDGYWLNMDDKIEIPYNFGIAAVYRTKDNLLFGKQQYLARHQPLAAIASHVEEYLATGLRLLAEWTNTLSEDHLLEAGWATDFGDSP